MSPQALIVQSQRLPSSSQPPKDQLVLRLFRETVGTGRNTLPVSSLKTKLRLECLGRGQSLFSEALASRSKNLSRISCACVQILAESSTPFVKPYCAEILLRPTGKSSPVPKGVGRMTPQGPHCASSLLFLIGNFLTETGVIIVWTKGSLRSVCSTPKRLQVK